VIEGTHLLGEETGAAGARAEPGVVRTRQTSAVARPATASAARAEVAEGRRDLDVSVEMDEIQQPGARLRRSRCDAPRWAVACSPKRTGAGSCPMSKDMSAMNEADPSVRDLAEMRRAAARHAEAARRRSEAAAVRQSQLAQARADVGRGTHDVSRATRAAVEALARSAEAHRSCAEVHEQAARFHERAAELAEGHGHGDRAARYREIAAKSRAAAADAARLAQEDRDRLAQQDQAVADQSWGA
jgi:hypothetical protein